MNIKLSLIVLFGLFFTNICLSQESSGSLGRSPTQNPHNIIKTQQPLSASDLQRNAINRVGFLAGRWEGTECVLMPDGKRQDCLSSDFAEAKLNGTVLVFEGVLKVKISPETNPLVVYEGLGILSFDENAQKYRLQHFGTDGITEVYECILSGKTLQCERRDKENAFVRVFLGVDNTGQWSERGERSQDGKTWHETFVTQMSKVGVHPDNGP